MFSTMHFISWPEFHGAVTHFPIAMLLAGILFDVVGVVSRRRDLRTVGFWMLVIAVLGGIASLVSGWITGGIWFPPEKPPIFYEHRLLAFTTIGLAVVLLAVRVAKKDGHEGAALSATVVLGLIAAASAGATGYFGGMMALPPTPVGSVPASATQSPASLKPVGANAPVLGTTPLLIADGQAAFYSSDLGCVSCHRINGVGGTMGPDLTHEALRHADLNWQISHLKNPQSMTKGSPMPPYVATPPATLKALAAFLVTRK